jgi:uncharacterized protein (DUF433 family)
MPTTHRSSIYGTRHPSTIPNYSIGDAARMLSLPQATVRAWVRGQPYPARSGRRRFERVIRSDDPSDRLLSFRNLVELHVLSAIRRDHHVTLRRVRTAVRYLERRLGMDHPLASAQLLTDGRSLLVEQFEQLINASEVGQIEIKAIVERFLQRIEHDEQGQPVRLFPITGDADVSPSAVVIDPRISFGQPCLKAAAVPTSVIADRLRAAESIESIAKDYGVTARDVEEAVRFELNRAA